MLGPITRHIRLPIKNKLLNNIPKHTHKNNIKPIKKEIPEQYVFPGLLNTNITSFANVINMF
jgi:hypothetical protein